MKRGRGEPDYAVEQVREEEGDIAQDRALALYAPQLLEQGQGHHLRIGEFLERRIDTLMLKSASSTRHNRTVIASSKR